MSDKFIPNADLDFKDMAMNFAKQISDDPEKYHVAQEDADDLVAAVEEFKTALQENFGAARNKITAHNKNQARAKTEAIIRRLAHMIRANTKIVPGAKIAIRIKDRAARTKKSLCPMEPPKLRFVRAHHQNSAVTPKHELRFSEIGLAGKSKPDGATRLELFVGLIAPEADVPVHPGDIQGRGAWYVRSYTKSPIIIEPPIARVPMRVVYWARWADNTGNVGPMCAPAIGWIEGGTVSRRSMQFNDKGREQIPMVEVDAPKQLVDERTYSVAVIEAHYLSYTPTHVEVPEENPKLEVTVIKEAKQIEGSVEEAA